MITFNDIKLVTKQVSEGTKLFDALKKLKISPTEFFKYLNDSPQDKLAFEQARQIATEQSLDEARAEIDGCVTELDLKKTTLKLKTNQWLAEKLIPQVYGPRMDINVNKTIDIRATLADARARVFVSSDVVELDILGDPKVSEGFS